MDTFPKLLLDLAARRGGDTAIREKDFGIWQSWTWGQVAEEVRALAMGLSAMGFHPGDNRPRLYWSMLAAQSLGGVPVPLYQDAIAEEMAFVFNDANIRFAVVEDQEQVDKLLEIKERCPALEHIVYDDPRGMRHYEQEFLNFYEEVQAIGRVRHQAHADAFRTLVAGTRPESVALMAYTSGTTGKPKGVCLTHTALINAARGAIGFDGLGSADEVLSYLPMAWIGDSLFSFAEALVAGFAINCPESGETVMHDMREIGPTFYFAPPRVFENLLTQVTIRMEDAGRVKRWLFDRFMTVARRCGAEILDGKRSVSAADRLLYALGNIVVFAPLRNALGMSRVRVAYTAGAAIGPDLFRFYRSIGINLKQLYGSTETCAYVCLQPTGGVKLDTVGKPAPGVEVRIAGNGEVLVRSSAMLKEYYRRPQETAEAIDAQGFFHTGDAGFFDDDGHLKIIDRAKDVGKLADGSLFAPNYVENKLKFYSYIKEAVAFGNGRDRVCAFINIDMPAVGDWAERRGIAYSGYTDLAGKPEVYDLIRGCVAKVNAELQHDPVLSRSQVHRFLILHKELDPDDDELTRTRKVRRGFIAQKYDVLTESLYAGRASQFIETQVRFEDGRSGLVSADLKIVDAPVFEPVAAAA